MLRTVIVAAATLALAPRMQAEDWTEFRGPGGQGHSTERNLPAEFGPTKNVAWKVEIPGDGWSSPVVFKDRVYLTTAVPLDENDGSGRAPTGGWSLRVLCLDAGDGSTLWNVEVLEQRAGGKHSKNTHASPTPIVDGRHIYVHFGTHGTACLTLDGETVWKMTDLAYSPVHGNGGSPALVDSLLVFSCDGADNPFVAARDKANGEIRWKTARPQVPNPSKFSFTTPLVIDVKGQKQLISAGSDVVAAYEPKTGEEIWRVTYDGYSVVPRPVYGHGLVYICTGWSPPKLLAIRPDGKGDVTESHVEWSTGRAAPNTPSPLLVEDELYFISDRGVVSCVDAKTGNSHWSERVGGDFSASPVFADGKIYFQSEKGETIVISPGLMYQELARNSFPGERTLASYAIADSALFIRTDTNLYRIQQR